MATFRIITLPRGRAVTLGFYVRVWKLVKAADPETAVTGFFSAPSTAQATLREIRKAMHERISEAIPYRHRGSASPLPPIGRKWGSDWQRAARYCAREVNTPRLIVRYVPHDFRERLAHRIYTDD
jgi:hypothetical protein